MATIEEEYAKKLGKLGKMVLGRDEIGYAALFSLVFGKILALNCGREAST